MRQGLAAFACRVDVVSELPALQLLGQKGHEV